MVLEIKLDDVTAGNGFTLDVFIYLLSFISIGILWVNHHIFKYAENIDHSTIWMNFILLFFASFIPLATKTVDYHFL